MMPYCVTAVLRDRYDIVLGHDAEAEYVRDLTRAGVNVIIAHPTHS